ncbi:MAG: beta-ketoacyl-ACP synthase III, partial [Pseudomonadota bacterium]|nr:beta-ketoacyl-ACP synthase III [Pseudomonadota bacterium]
MSDIVISGTGLYTPPNSISNEELVSSFNTYVDQYNTQHQVQIANGEVEALEHSSAEFVEKVSGIKARYVIEKDSILNPEIMAPRIPERANDELSVLAEIAVNAAKDALKTAN